MKNITKIRKIIKQNQQDIVLSAAVILMTVISFNAGKIYGKANIGKGIEIIEPTSRETSALDAESEQKSGTAPKLDFRVVVSKNSNKYHFLWCSGAKLIKEENKIYFESENEAQSRGYTLAGNCTK